MLYLIFSFAEGSNMHRRFASLIVVALAWVIGFPASAASSSKAPAAPPKLVLQITVDQLRGDMLGRYEHRFGKDGFKRLMEGGTWYTNAHYGTANTVTAS